MFLRAKPLLSSFLVTSLLFGLYTGWVGQWEVSAKIRYGLQDLLARHDYRKHRPSPLAKDIALVAIADSTYEFFNSRNPLDRKHLANVIESIRLQEPRQLILDFSFMGASTPDSDEQLRDVFSKTKDLLVASYFDEQERFMRPFPLLQPYAKFGTVNRIRDSDFRIRVSRTVHAGFSQKDHHYSLDTLVAAKVLNAEPLFDGKFLNFKNSEANVVHRVPVNYDGRMRIRYRINSQDIPIIPAEMMLHPQLPRDLLKDKIVFMGSIGLIDHDHHATPLGTLPGVVIMMNAFETILMGNTLQEVPVHWQWLCYLLLGWLIAFIAYKYPYWAGILVAMILGAGLSYLSLHLFEVGWIVDDLGLLWMLLGALLVAFLHRSIGVAYDAMQLRIQATTDELTGIANFRYLQVRLDHILNTPKSEYSSLALIMFDMDGFKAVNDIHGHAAGNELLIQFSELMKTMQRKKDIIARFGGDEFCILLHDSTPDQVNMVAERLRKATEERVFDIEGKPIQVTLSIGAVLFNAFKGKTAKQFIEAADKCLYASKEAGKNCVTFAQHD